MTALGPWTVESVSAAALIELAPILNDPNPIHLDGAAAAAAGLGDRPVNQGPANIGYCVTMLRRACRFWLDGDDRSRALEGTAVIVSPPTSTSPEPEEQQ